MMQPEQNKWPQESSCRAFEEQSLRDFSWHAPLCSTFALTLLIRVRGACVAAACSAALRLETRRLRSTKTFVLRGMRTRW
jgi:hypothetical protein